MTKIVRNTTASPLPVTDTGVTIAASSSYTIPAQDYWLWAASGDAVTVIGSGAAVINDGSADLSISDGTDLIKGIYQKNRIIGNTDGTLIGNISDRLKTQNVPAQHAPNLTTTGNLTALNSTVSTSVLDGLGTAGIIILGTWVGTITFQGSIDGTNWVSMPAQPLTGGVIGSTTAANGSFRVNVTGLQSVRVLMSAYTSGTANVVIECTAEAGFIRTLSTLTGGTDGSQIGNTGDRLKVDATFSGTSTAVMTPSNIVKQNEISIAVKTQTVLPSSTYTVPAGKTFSLTTFGGSYDGQQPMYIRFQKQTGGSGAFATVLRETLSVNGQDSSNFSIIIPTGLLVGVATDVFQITYEAAVARGTLWAGYTGIEV